MKNELKIKEKRWRYRQKVEVTSPPPIKYLHPNNPKFTLKIGKVEVVETSEVFPYYPVTDSYKTGSHQI
jgi:hypothetical protein